MVNKKTFTTVVISVALAVAIMLVLFLSPRKKARDSVFEDKSGNFETTANIKYKEIEATAVIKQESPKSCSVTFSSPPSLKDMEFNFHSEGIDLTYKGLSFTFDPSSLPGKAVAEIVVKSIQKAFKNENISLDFKDDVITIAGVLESGEFILTLDAQSENLLKLSIPGEELEIEFINFKFLD